MTDWQQHYATGDTPWEKGTAHPELAAFLRKQVVPGRGLVPGCGHGHDVRALAASADEVVGLDIADGAIERAKQYPVVGGEHYVVGDLFALPPRSRASFDWVFEHTCFCAIPTEMRGDYIRAVSQAVRPGGLLLAIFYLDPQLDPGETGPPFGVTVEELNERFGPHFDLLQEWIPSVTYPGREGLELFRIMRRRDETAD
jgi:SAM-dependent methyltransferase